MIRGEKEVKKSYEKLLGHYGNSFSSIVARRPLRTSDFLDAKGNPTALVKDLAARVVGFQVNPQTSKSPTQTSLDKYRRLLGEDVAPGALGPAEVLAPYFHFSDSDDPWLQVNRLLVRETLRAKEKREAHVVIATSPTWLGNDEIDNLRTIFKGVDGVILWLAGQGEAKRTRIELESLRRAVARFSSSGLKVHILHSGYFSLCLGPDGSSRVTSGIGFGESREVTAKPTGGGFPARYYLELVRQQANVSNVRTLLSDQPGLLCDCRACSIARKSAGIRSGAKPTVKQIESFFDWMDNDALRGHYMECRFRESQSIGRTTAKQLSHRLKDSYEEAVGVKVDDYRLPYKHLKTWSEALGTPLT